MRTVPRAGGPPEALALTLLALSLPGSQAVAQGRELSLELGGSSIAPPSGVEGDAARFLVMGLRASTFDFSGTGLMASVLAGRTLDEGTGGDFLSGSLEASAWRSLGSGWSAGLEAKGFGFDIRQPYPYRSLGAEGGPSLRFGSEHFSATLGALGGRGWSRVALSRTMGGGASLVEDDLWRYGGTLELLAGSPRVMAGLSGGIHESVGGTYRSAGARVLAGGGRGALELRIDGWKTPLGSEVTGGVAFVLRTDGWSLRGFMGRSEPDPLTLAEPGGGSGGLLLGRRLLGSDPLPPPRSPLHRVVELGEGAALVEIRVAAPVGAGSVMLTGDFTLWEPRPMEPDEDGWIARVEIPLGTHHFGFLVDGEWYVPPDAPDAVPDEWGRTNATLVIER